MPACSVLPVVFFTDVFLMRAPPVARAKGLRLGSRLGLKT